MGLGSNTQRGAQLLAQASVIVQGTVIIPAGAEAYTPEIVCSVNQARLLVWARQITGAGQAGCTPEFSFTQAVLTNVVDWDRIVETFLLPAAGVVSRSTYEHPARRFRVKFDAPAPNGVTIRYYVVGWAV